VRVSRELTERVEYLVKNRIWDQVKEKIELESLVEKIVHRQLDPYSAAGDLLEKINFYGDDAEKGG